MSNTRRAARPDAAWRSYKPHDATVWLREQTIRILRQLNSVGVPRDGRTVVVVPIHPCAPASDEDYRCDRCRRDTRPGTMHAGWYEPLPDLRITFGLCDDCAAKETGEKGER